MKVWFSAFVLGSLTLTSLPSAADVLIATALPHTGRYAWFGEQGQQGASLAVEDINSAGGVLGERVRLFIGDDACDPQQGAALARKIVSLKAVFVVGHGCSGPALAAGPIYEEAAIVVISPAATHPARTSQGWKYHFRLAGNDNEQARLAADYLERRHKSQSVAVLYDETVYSRNLAHTLRAELERLSPRVALFTGIDVDGFNWRRLVDGMQARDVTVAYFAGRTSDVGLLARHAGDVGYNLDIVGSDPLNSEQFWLVAGEAGEGTVFTSIPDARQWPTASKVVERFRQSGYEPEGFALHIYAAIQAWAEAVAEAGSTKAEYVAEALRSGKVSTILGEIGFDEKGDVVGLQTFRWFGWTNGRYEPLDDMAGRRE